MALSLMRQNGSAHCVRFSGVILRDEHFCTKTLHSTSSLLLCSASEMQLCGSVDVDREKNII